MAKRRLNPPFRKGGVLMGPNVLEVKVVEWCPSLDGSGPATAVAIAIITDTVGDLVLRMETPQAVDEMIQMLLRHKRGVWPDAP